MAKRPLKLKVRIPEYRTPRQAWRRALWHAVEAERQRLGVIYAPDDLLEVHLTLYMNRNSLFFHDVDNRLKDCLDALQAKTGGRRFGEGLTPLIPNDRQIWRVVAEKGPAPRQARGRGHLMIRKLKRRLAKAARAA
jgi:hypothetical protein